MHAHVSIFCLNKLVSKLYNHLSRKILSICPSYRLLYPDLSDPAVY